MDLSPITISTDPPSIWIFWDFCFFLYFKIFPFCHMWYSSVCPLLIKCLPCGLYLKEKPGNQKHGQFVPQVSAFHLFSMHHTSHSLYDIAGGISGCTSDKKKIHVPTQETWVQPLGWEDPLERKWQHAPVFLPGKFC